MVSATSFRNTQLAKNMLSWVKNLHHYTFIYMTHTFSFTPEPTFFCLLSLLLNLAEPHHQIPLLPLYLLFLFFNVLPHLLLLFQLLPADKDTAVKSRQRELPTWCMAQADKCPSVGSAHTFKSRFKTWIHKLLWCHWNTQTKDNTFVVVTQRRYLQVKALTWTDMLKRNYLDISTYARVNTYQSGVFELQWRVSPLCLLPCWNVGVNDMLNTANLDGLWLAITVSNAHQISLTVIPKPSFATIILIIMVWTTPSTSVRWVLKQYIYTALYRCGSWCGQPIRLSIREILSLDWLI